MQLDLQESSSHPEKRPFTALWLGVPTLIVAAQIWYCAPRLPERVASHFDGAGNPDGWMDRESFLFLMGGIVVAVAVFFAFLIWILPKIPVSMVNMPNREFWLEASRRESTHAAIAKNVLGHAVLMIALMAWILHGTYQVSTSSDGERSLSIWPPVLAYLAVTALLIAQLYRRFRLPGTASKKTME